MRRYQYTAIDDAPHARFLKIYERYTQKNAIDFVDYFPKRFPFHIHTIQTDNGHEFQSQFHWYCEEKHVYIKLRSPLMARWSDHMALINKSFIS